MKPLLVANIHEAFMPQNIKNYIESQHEVFVGHKHLQNNDPCPLNTFYKKTQHF